MLVEVRGNLVNLDALAASKSSTLARVRFAAPNSNPRDFLPVAETRLPIACRQHGPPAAMDRLALLDQPDCFLRRHLLFRTQEGTGIKLYGKDQ